MPRIDTFEYFLKFHLCATISMDKSPRTRVSYALRPVHNGGEPPPLRPRSGGAPSGVRWLGGGEGAAAATPGPHPRDARRRPRQCAPRRAAALGRRSAPNGGGDAHGGKPPPIAPLCRDPTPDPRGAGFPRGASRDDFFIPSSFHHKRQTICGRRIPRKPDPLTSRTVGSHRWVPPRRRPDPDGEHVSLLRPKGEAPPPSEVDDSDGASVGHGGGGGGRVGGWWTPPVILGFLLLINALIYFDRGCGSAPEHVPRVPPPPRAISVTVPYIKNDTLVAGYPEHQLTGGQVGASHRETRGHLRGEEPLHLRDVGCVDPPPVSLRENNPKKFLWPGLSPGHGRGAQPVVVRLSAPPIPANISRPCPEAGLS